MKVLDESGGAYRGSGKILKLVRAILALAIVLAPLAAVGQSLTDGERASLQAQKAALFQKTLSNPDDLDAAFAYADVAVRLGDYEAAVGTLERMLLFNPNLAQLQLDLGALYFRMGSYDLARAYLDKAAVANPSPEARRRIDDYLAQIDAAQSRHHFSGYLFGGGQYQSDANLAPGSFLPLVQMPPNFPKQASGSLFGNGAGIYSYDLEDQNRDTIDVTAAGALNHYFNSAVSRLDLSLLELTAGPRFNFPNGTFTSGKSASFRPYPIFDEVGLGWNQYFTAIGFGLEYDQIVWRDLALKSLFEFRHKNFTNAPSRPLSTGLDGNDSLVTLLLTKPMTEKSTLNLQFDYLNQATSLAYYTNTSYALSGSYQIGYDAPLKLTSSQWQSSIFLGRSWSYYAAPDPCCNTSGDPAAPSPSSQLTQRWRFGFIQTWPVSAKISIVFQAERDIVSSNLSLYAYTNTSVLIGPQIRF